jgi:peptidylprolyl isomerase
MTMFRTAASAAVLSLTLMTAACAQEAPPAAAAPAVPAPPPGPENWRTPDPQNLWVLETSKGRVVVELYPEIAPRHVERIKALTRSGFYDGLAFHRVIEGFMAQGGDPKGDGTGGSQLGNLAQEFEFRRGADMAFHTFAEQAGVDLGFVGAMAAISQPSALMTPERSRDGKVRAFGLHCPGVASMARAMDPNSANSQFFLMRATYPSLNQQYTVWGRAIDGLDVIRSFKTGEPVVDPDRIRTARIAADLPAAQRPRLEVQRTDGPAFKAYAAAEMAARGEAFDPCDLQVASRTLP